MKVTKREITCEAGRVFGAADVFASRVHESGNAHSGWWVSVIVSRGLVLTAHHETRMGARRLVYSQLVNLHRLTPT